MTLGTKQLVRTEAQLDPHKWSGDLCPRGELIANDTLVPAQGRLKLQDPPGALAASP